MKLHEIKGSLKPNLIIFRLPDKDGDMEFVELDYANGKLATKGKPFTVLPENDNYRSMRFDHVVIASKIPNGSHDLNRFAINGDGDEPAVINKINHEELTKIVEHLVQTHLSLH